MSVDDLVKSDANRVASARRFRNPAVEGLASLAKAGLSLIPVAGSAAATVMGDAMLAAWQRRIEVFIDEIDSRLHEVPEHVLRSEEFVQAFSSAYRAAVSTQQDEKITLFARLFTTYANGDVAASADVYEEYLRVLDDLSVREFHLLLILDELGATVPGEREFLTRLVDRVEQELKIPLHEIPGALARLTRTGLYQSRPNSGPRTPVEKPVYRTERWQ